MSDLKLAQDNILVSQWMKAERNGTQFPVPLHQYWAIAGHGKKQDAFLLAETRLEEGFDYLRSTVNRSDGKPGRKAKALFLSVAALERFCLAAHTPEGDAVRELYRQAKAKWDIVQQQHPAIAQEVELQHLRNEGLRLEAQKVQAELQLAQFRHVVVATLPEVAQQKILGYTEIKTTEYIDRTILPSGEAFDGVGITYIQKRYGFKTTKAAWAWLESLGCGKNSDAWHHELCAVESSKLPREFLGQLDDQWRRDRGDRQLFMGE